jgi:hypothetical protein
MSPSSSSSSLSSSLVEKGGYCYCCSRDKPCTGPPALTRALIGLVAGDFTAAWRGRLAGDKPSRAAKRGASGVAGCGDTARATDKNNEKFSDTLLSEIVKGLCMGELVKYDEWNG